MRRSRRTATSCAAPVPRPRLRPCLRRPILLLLLLMLLMLMLLMLLMLTGCAPLSWRIRTTTWPSLDAEGGFFTKRWGDACVHMLAVASLLPRSRVLQLASLAYWHQGTVVLPEALAQAASTLLPPDIPMPAFATGQGQERQDDGSSLRTQTARPRAVTRAGAAAAGHDEL